MESPELFYKEGYKYWVYQDYSINTEILLGYSGGNDFVSITPDGTLSIKKGYAWDGASGPVPRLKSFVKGSLGHDALYQLIRIGVVPLKDKDKVDKIMYNLFKSDSMWPPLAYIAHEAVTVLGGMALSSENPVLVIPEGKNE